MSVKIVILLQLVILVAHAQCSDVSDFEPELIEGDIVADKKLLRLIEHSKVNRQKRDVLKGHLHLWKDGLIPYVISNEISKKLRKVIRRAFRRFAEKTCIRFTPKQDEHKDYIYFIQGVGCFSKVGRNKGRQVISLGLTCQSRVKAVHEIMHALGFLHEHSRPDRDTYVKILYWNIVDDQERNFIAYSHDRVSILAEPYDYKSIMHYDNKAFTKNGKDTIQVLNNPDTRLGQERHLSKIDIRQIHKLYKCDRIRAKLNGDTRQRRCENKYPECNYYAENSEACENNNFFMKAYCELSCGFCGYG